MTDEEYSKLFRIRCKGKRGIPLSDIEQKFCEDMYKAHPSKYSSMSSDIHKETSPLNIRSQYND